jgi:hypothetical protein
MTAFWDIAPFGLFEAVIALMMEAVRTSKPLVRFNAISQKAVSFLLN